MNSIYNGRMPKWRFVFIGIASICLALLVSISIPVRQVTEQISFTLADRTAGEILLDTPAYLRMGDRAEVRMELSLEGDHLKSESLKVKVELQSTSLEVNPTGGVTAVIPANGRGPFKWQVRSSTNNELTASLWCFRVETGELTLIFARELQFETRTILGVRYDMVRGLLIGITILCLILVSISFQSKKNRIK